MTLRTQNDQITVQQYLAALGTVMPNDKASGYTLPNTQLGIAGGSVLINDVTPILKRTATFPVLLLTEAQQPGKKRLAWRTWQEDVTVMADYMQKWQQNTAQNAEGQTQSFDDIWAATDIDFRRMIANVEDNSRLLVGGTRYAVSTIIKDISPYAKELDNQTYNGITVIHRFGAIYSCLPPYISGS